MGDVAETNTAVVMLLARLCIAYSVSNSEQLARLQRYLYINVTCTMVLAPSQRHIKDCWKIMVARE